ncbi:unnamed protein product [Dicrocoelium dendriticum]|nr:unnamed protein product [Dicrocoelium dendriticum]
MLPPTVLKLTLAADRRVILPLDEGDNNLDVVQWYLDELVRPGDVLLFVYNVRPTPVPSATRFPVLLGTMLTIGQSTIRKGKSKCREAMQLAKNYGVNAHSFLYVHAKPHLTLTNAVRELNADLVILGHRTFTTYGKAVSEDSCTARKTVSNVPVELAKPVIRTVPRSRNYSC